MGIGIQTSELNIERLAGEAVSVMEMLKVFLKRLGMKKRGY